MFRSASANSIMSRRSPCPVDHPYMGTGVSQAGPQPIFWRKNGDNIHAALSSEHPGNTKWYLLSHAEQRHRQQIHRLSPHWRSSITAALSGHDRITELHWHPVPAVSWAVSRRTLVQSIILTNMSECCDEYGAERTRSSNGILLVANLNVLRDSGSHRAHGI